MHAFRGFQDSETFTALPDSLFQELLAYIEDASELKVLLHALWSGQHMQGGPVALTMADFAAAPLGLLPDQVRRGLDMAVEHGFLLTGGQGATARYFLNSPAGRAAIESGRSEGAAVGERSLDPTERPNIFKVYEANIGPLTPLIADALKDAEEAYPEDWILEAVDLAVRNNKRSWSYCEAILRRWKEEGRGTKQNRRDDQAARQRDVEEKIRKFIRG